MTKIITMGEGLTKTTIVELEFKGFYQEKQIEGIANVDGIYVAHACTLQVDVNGKETCTPLRVIYIGKGTGTDNVHTRVGKHKNEDHSIWKKHLNAGEHILYSYAECPANIVQDVEAALIYRNQPVENIVSKDRYTGETHLLTVKSTGMVGTLKNSVTVL